MPPLSEGQGLQEAIRTTLAQLCKVGVNYQNELSLKGTIGLTIDKKEVILVHFNEIMENGDLAVDSSQNCYPNVSNSGLNTSSAISSGYSPSSSNHKPKVEGSGPRFSSIIKHTSLAEFGKTMMNVDASKISSSSLWHSYVMSNSDGLKEPASSFNEPHQLSTSAFIGRQIGKIEVPTATTLSDRFAMDVTDRKGLLSLEETITIDLDSDSETFDTSLNFEDVDEKLVCGITEKKFDQKQEAVFSDDGDGFDAMSGMDVKAKVFQDLDSGQPLDVADADNGGSPGKLVEQPSTSSIGKATLGSIPVFVTKSEILDAKEAWDEEPWYDCDTNMEMMSEPDSLNWGKSKYYSCEVCAKQLPSIGKLEAHLVETHKLTESKEYGSIVFKQCSHCGKKFRFQATLDKHLFLHVANRSFKCNLCSNTYCFPESLEIHMGAHNGNYSCKKCKKSYSTKTLFQKHIVYKHEQRQHSNKS